MIVESVEYLDQQIQLAWSRLRRARREFADTPTGEAVSKCEQHEKDLNELLDTRQLLTVNQRVRVAA